MSSTSTSTTSSSNNNNAVNTIQIKNKQYKIYKQNTKLYYKQGGSSTSLVPVQIIKVHLDDIEPYYTIRLLGNESGNNCREKQTDNDHLTLDKPILNDEFGGSSSSDGEEEERLQSRRVHWKNEDKSQMTSTGIEQEDDKTSGSSKSSSKTLHTWQLEQIAKHVNEHKEDTTEEKKKVLEAWQLDQITKHMKEQKQSSSNDNVKDSSMNDAEGEEECSIITEECSIDTNDSSKNDKKTEGIEQQVVAMEESWFCC